MVHPKVVKETCNFELVDWPEIRDVDALIFAVAHDEYLKLSPKELRQKLNNRGLIIDVKSIFNSEDFKDSGILLWRL